MKLLKNIGIILIFLLCLAMLVYTFAAFFFSIIDILFYTK